MYDRPRLSNTALKAIQQGADPTGLKDRQDFAGINTRKRLSGVKRWYKEGGYWAVAWIKEHYRTWAGEKLSWDDPFFEEFFLFLGNPWFETEFIEKSAQVGWTEAAIALNAFALAELRIPCGVGFEQERKLEKLVGTRFQTAFDHCAPIVKIRSDYHKITKRKDIDQKCQQVTVGGISNNYFPASTSAKKEGKGRQASSALSSFTSCLIIGDEVELWPPGAIDVAKKRMEASRLPTRPFRAGSTPGQVMGITDSYMKSARHLFQWQVFCPCCDKPQFLDPFGNFLKPVEHEENGTIDIIYLDKVGRPIDWFYHDPERKEQTAYLGCQFCAGELTPSSIRAGKFVCRNTGESLREIHDRTLEEQKPIHETIGIRLPKLAISSFSASERIRILRTTRNPTDEIQQGLGKPFSLGGGRISHAQIMDCIGRDIPDVCKDWRKLVVAGVDQGVAGNIVVVQNWWLPPDGKDDQDIWEKAFVETFFHGEVTGGFTELHRMFVNYEVNLVGIDGEPELEKAGDFAREHPIRYSDDYTVFLFDQVHLRTGQKYAPSKRTIQGVKTLVFKLHRSAGLDAVRDRIYRGLHRLPSGLQFNPKDKSSLIYQLQTSERMDDGRWVEPAGEPDHFHHALNFAEMAVLVDSYENAPGIVFSTFTK